MSGEPPPDLPPEWRARLSGYGWAPQAIGRSGATVFRLEAPGRPTLFLKSEPTAPRGELRGEAARLRWLATQGIPCPAVQAETEAAGRVWLLAGAVPGRDLASSPEVAPEQVAALAAKALRALHRLDPGSCPFDHRLARRIDDARARLEAKLVDETHFDAERHGRTATDLFDELLSRRPADEDVVVTHGDACLPNLLADAGQFTGFVDCARLGIADRHQDLALASWSIEHNVGAEWVAPFLECYGFAAHPEKLAFYRMLDEFF